MINKIKLTVWAVLITLTLQAQQTFNQTPDFVPGQVLIKLKESAKAQKVSLNIQMKATTLKSYTNLGIELWEMNQVNGKQATTKQATLDLIEQYKNHPDVEYVEPNYLWYADDCIEPNDPFFSQLWGLNNTGQDDGTPDADIDVPEAYNIPLGDLSEVVVGIVDTGIDYTHEDLAENIWQNLGEDANGNGVVLIQSGDTWIFDPGDENGIDDDGNGYADDFVGWDFAYGDNNPSDLRGHGTHVAGTVGAITNNNIGINGVAPNVKLAALKFLNNGGSGYTSDAVEAINYAVAMSIPITNNSWGGGPYSTALFQAIENGANNNHLFVTSAGNSSRNIDTSPQYPAAYESDNIISVASTTKNDDLSYFSNYGLTRVDIGAPGSEIFSTEPGNTYGNKNGTSMASPHVAGVAAYMLGAYPGTPYTTIKQNMLNAADPIPALNGKCVSNGRLNLYNALQEMGAPANSCDDICEYPECDDCEAPPCNDDPPPTCSRLTDSLALVALYNATDGPNWTIGWDFNQPMDNWFGVTLTDGRVTCLDMDGSHDCYSWTSDGNNLNGNIPPEIEDLCELTILNVRYNQLNGNIPNEIGSLTKLEILDARSNSLDGEIPSSFVNLTQLKDITFSSNNLEGNVLDIIVNFPNLEYFHTSFSNFSGIIPSSIGNLTQLKEFSIHGNNFSGILPPEISTLDQLTLFSIGENQLEGCYPNNFSNLCSVITSHPVWWNAGNNFDAPMEDFCDTGAGSCDGSESQVWPGDSDNNGIVEYRDMIFWGVANGNTGPTRPNATANWSGQDCPDWSVEVNGVNGKHQDNDGNGVVDYEDQNVITQNLGQTHNFTEYGEVISTLQFTLNPDLSASSGDIYVYEFFIDDAGNTVSAHGINTSIFFGGLSVGSAVVDVSGSSLNPQEVLQEFDTESNTLHFVLTKTNGINSTLNGSVCKVIVQILEVDNGSSSALYVNGGGVMQADGTLEEVAGTTVNSTFFEPGINSSLIDLTSSTSHANCGIGGKAKVYASGSTAPYTYLWSTGETTQQIVDLSPGIYAVVVTDTDGNSATLEIEVQGQFVPIYDEDGNILPCNVTDNESGIFLGQAQINGIPAEPGDRLIAIDENGNTTGLDLMGFFNGIAYINLPIYGDDLTTSNIDEGVSIGEYFTLQIYDASENAYYDYAQGGQIVEFTGWENTDGAPFAAYSNSDDVYNFSTVCSQSLNLNAGWNLISFNNTPANNAVASVFADLIASGNLEFITGFDSGASVFDPVLPPPFNTLQTIEDGFGYWVKVFNAGVLTSTGGCIDAGYRKPLDAGWNLVAYPSFAPQPPSTYFADLIAAGNLEFVTGFDGGTYTFDPAIPIPFNTLQQLENGFGYWVKVYNPAKTAGNLTNVFSFIYGTSNLPDSEQVEALNEKGETIAIIDVVEAGYLMTTPIYGDDETTAKKEYINIGEDLRFSWNNQIVDFTTTFKGDYGVETIHLEFKLENSVTSIYEEVNFGDFVNVFPNPLTDKANIVYNLEKDDNVTISLISASGQLVTTLVENQIQQAGQHQVVLNAVDLPTGIYYLKLQSTESNIIEKLVISK